MAQAGSTITLLLINLINKLLTIWPLGMACDLMNYMPIKIWIDAKLTPSQ